MARVTVEDCILLVPNRFELVMVAAQRAREISGGMQITLDRDKDKNPVVALREIAESTVSLDELRNSMIAGLQRHVEQDEPEEEDNLELLMRRNLEQAAAASQAGIFEIPTPVEDLALDAEEDQAVQPAAVKADGDSDVDAPGQPEDN